MISIKMREEIGHRLAICRLDSHNEKYRSQEALADALGITRRKLYEIETGKAALNLLIVAKWCQLTEHYEQWESIEYLLGLTPFSVPPISKDLQQRVSDTAINLRIQMKQAYEALKEFIELRHAQRPGRPISEDAEERMKSCAKQLFDMMIAVQSFLIAWQREDGVPINETTRIWTQDAVSKELTEQIYMMQPQAVAR